MNNLQSDSIQLTLFEKPRSNNWEDRFLNHEFTFNPGVILLKKLVGLYRKDQLPLYRQLGVSGAILVAIIEDKRKLDYRIAAKLAALFQTSAQHWLDIQSRYEAFKFVRSYPFKDDFIYDTLFEYIQLVNQRPNQYFSQVKLAHPGEVLLNEYINPSGLTVADWQNILMLSKPALKVILDGRGEMPFPVIVTLCRVFRTPARFWLDSQNGYYAAMGDQHLLKD